MAKGERKACPLCGTLVSLCCNAVKKQQVSRFARWENDVTGHKLHMVPVIHRHPAKAADHEEQARILAENVRLPIFPLAGFDYRGGS